MMNNNDDLTIAARVKGWGIFAPDWDYLLQRTSLPLVSLCALSVGLHPYFADQSWVFNIAMPHFNGADSDECCPLDDAEEGAKRAALLHNFIQRVNIAKDDLAPRGGLTSIEGDGDAAILRLADFAAWAIGKNWTLPSEFPQPDAASYPLAPEGLKIGGSEDKPLSTVERNTLLKLVIGMAIKGYGYDPQAKRSDIPKSIETDLVQLGIAITDDTVRKWLNEAANTVLPQKPH